MRSDIDATRPTAFVTITLTGTTHRTTGIRRHSGWESAGRSHTQHHGRSFQARLHSSEQCGACIPKQPRTPFEIETAFGTLPAQRLAVQLRRINKLVQMSCRIHVSKTPRSRSTRSGVRCNGLLGQRSEWFEFYQQIGKQWKRLSILL
jgi:hypothetical protein